MTKILTQQGWNEVCNKARNNIDNIQTNTYLTVENSPKRYVSTHGLERCLVLILHGETHSLIAHFDPGMYSNQDQITKVINDFNSKNKQGNSIKKPQAYIYGLELLDNNKIEKEQREKKQIEDIRNKFYKIIEKNFDLNKSINSFQQYIDPYTQKLEVIFNTKDSNTQIYINTSGQEISDELNNNISDRDKRRNKIGNRMSKRNLGIEVTMANLNEINNPCKDKSAIVVESKIIENKPKLERIEDKKDSFTNLSSINNLNSDPAKEDQYKKVEEFVKNLIFTRQGDNKLNINKNEYSINIDILNNDKYNDNRWVEKCMKMKDKHGLGSYR